MQRFSKFQVLIIIAISLLLGYWIGLQKINFDWKNFHPKITVVNKEPPSGISSVDFSAFWAVWQKSNNHPIIGY